MTESRAPLPTAYKDLTHLSSTPTVRIIPSSQRPQNKPKLFCPSKWTCFHERKFLYSHRERAMPYQFSNSKH
jgi:hypothetical protein